MLKQKHRKKVKLTFYYSLAIISILGFLAIILNAWFSINLLNTYMPGLILITLGCGLIIEGQIRRWLKYTKNGITDNEFSHIVTGVIGLIAIISGLLVLFGVNNNIINSVKGIVSTIAIIMIIVETWFIK